MKRVLIYDKIRLKIIRNKSDIRPVTYDGREVLVRRKLDSFVADSGFDY